MVLSKAELITALQKEVSILIHLAKKLDQTSSNYRPTSKQRSSLELLRYLTVMGPTLIEATRNGGFDPAVWASRVAHAETLDLDGIVAALEAQKATYSTLVQAFPEEDLRSQIEMFGHSSSKGAFIVNLVLGGCAAYRTQLFLYLKSSGREELGTLNLWQGMDAPIPTPAS